ncbi:MAG: amino acid permease [Thermoflexibacter sp.]|jgi:amino acid transporter|nr:amino acid permease [Thermoflexibacter sp.]
MPNGYERSKKKGLGTIPVFFLSISTLLGAVMLLRFGYVVAHVGLLSSLAMILLGHLATIPTALALSEIATNQKVEGGGEYFIISRSFGLIIGASIGMVLYMAQAGLVAIYIVSFSRAFEPFFEYLLASDLSIYVMDYRVVSIPAFIFLCVLIYYRGNTILYQSLFVVVPLLILAGGLFLFSENTYRQSLSITTINQHIPHNLRFFDVFAYCFPALCGVTAGLGFSGNLRNPKRAIPLGIITSVVSALFIYIIVLIKLYMAASPTQLASDPFLMYKLANSNVIFPVALAAVCISSAVGSMLMAGRTLQGLANDRVFPSVRLNRWLARIHRDQNFLPETLNAIIITSLVVLILVIINDLDLLLQVVSVLFTLTCGSICLISFLEHFGADPAYRPSFRSRWFISLIGAVVCIFLGINIKMNYTLLFLGFMVLVYFGVSTLQHKNQGLSVIFQGVTFQISRRLQVFLQKVKKEPEAEHWRPSIVCLSSASFERTSAFELLRWFSYRYGFGTYIHLIDGYFSKDTNIEAKEAFKRLVNISEQTESNVFIDTLISPSFTTAIVQVIQIPGIAGKENNVVLFEFSKNNYETAEDIVDNFQLVKVSDFDVCVLASSEKHFGFRNEIHIWITTNDYENANLMILLAYILLGHPDWKEASIKIFAIYPEDEMAEEKKNLMDLIYAGRLPISAGNVEFISQKESGGTKQIINQKSKYADLTIVGVRTELIKHIGAEVFQGYDEVGDILFVNTQSMKMLR